MQKQDKPLLSICIPTYNRQEILRETLEFLADTLQPSYEIVVSNNCSSDHTIDVLEDFKKRWKRFRYITQPKQLVLMENLAASTLMAQGKYLYTLSDDDRLLIEGLHKAISMMEESPDIVGVFGGHQEWDQEEDRVIDTFKITNQVLVFPKGQRSKHEALHTTNRLWFPVIRTDICRRFCIIAYNKETWGYWQFTGKMLDHGKIAMIPDIFYKHAQTEPRAEYDLTEGWYHDMYRSDFEAYIGEMGRGTPENALFINRKTSLAYKQGVKFAALKGEWLKVRHFLLRARAYGLYEDEELIQLEKSHLLKMTAERLQNLLAVIPSLKRVVFEEHPISEMMSSFLVKILPGVDICQVTRDQLLNRPTKPEEAIIALDNLTLCKRSEKLEEDPIRQHALMDIFDTCRLTNAKLNLDL